MALGYVRPARPGDVDEIARVQLSTWRTAFPGIVPDSVLDSLEEPWLAKRWAEACAEPPTPTHRVLVAIEQSETDDSIRHTVGFAAVGPAEEGEDAGPGVGAMTELIVEPRFGRRGHGSRLLSAAAAFWRENGFTTGLAWVFVRDAATLNFYKSAGWAPDCTRRTLDMDGTLVPQLRLHTDLTADPE